MLTEERFRKILAIVEQEKTATVAALSERLETSESTIRRDLTALAEQGRLNKVHGGAVALEQGYAAPERSMEAKQKLFLAEKDAIARYAASTLRSGDFVFIDAGSTTERMIDYITERDITFVTNGFLHATKLAKKGYTVYITGGEVKPTTEAIVGAACINCLRNYNFTKCYLGTNGISLTAGFTTPDINEASVKETAVGCSYVTYILADHSKFNTASQVTFARLSNACIITDRVPDQEYRERCIIKEVTQ